MSIAPACKCPQVQPEGSTGNSLRRRRITTPTKPTTATEASLGDVSNPKPREMKMPDTFVSLESDQPHHVNQAASLSYGPSQEDEYVLSLAARWQRARSQALLTWAVSSEKDLFGTIGEEISCPDEALGEMKRALEQLAEVEPKTVRGGREMLNVVLAVLAHRETDSDVESSTMASGPILQIVRNVRNAMSFNCDAPLGRWPTT